ncbi:hypothetical protein KCG46_03445 [Erythrobacter sp. WH158]|uniref:Cytochrome c domain-containing protein n=1 Tax=Erythrobacter crassostreae TaxID=2828328 RepID=A0A9X1F1K9_9SPHN|nr:hypothetical protein [Erythrobacter crassostrea]
MTSFSLRFAAICTTALLLSACHTAASPQLTASLQPSSLISGVCGDCHAVERAFDSPNPNAPSFVAIANRNGLTRETLGPWLLDAHNYPLQMDFELSEAEAKQIADYMLALRSDQYRPEL